MAACFLCPHVESVQLCSDCLSVSFCSHHEKYHRGEEGCYPYRVEEREVVGRILVAAKHINPGDIIFKEKELVVGPCKGTEPVCIGCGRAVTFLERCSGCSWPVCSATCSQLPSHSQKECGIIAPSGPHICKEDSSSWQVYDAVLVVRVLLLEEVERDYLLLFMDHTDNRDNKQAYEDIVEILRESWGQEHYTPQIITRIAGILDINTVEHRVPGSTSARGFLPITSLASHSCISNSFKDKTEPGWVVTRAKIEIREGEEITFHYSAGLKSRLVRRQILRDGWCFWCSCPRCQSPHELGSEISTLKCRADGCGGNIRAARPLDAGSPYRCDACGGEETAATVHQREDDLTARLEDCYRNDTVGLLALLRDVETIFHPHHYLTLIIKWLLITGWGRIPGQEHAKLGEEVLEEKVTLAKDYLAAMDVLDPGISHNRGITLWELYSAHTFLLNKRFQEEKLAPVKFLCGLKENLARVEEAADCLRFNQEETAEARIRQLCLQASSNLNKTIEFFSSVIPQ